MGKRECRTLVFLFQTMESLIDKVKKSDSFQVPDGYFDSLPDQVMHRIETAEQVDHLLDGRPVGDSFPVPEGYFAALPDQVMDRVRAGEKRRVLFRRRLITAVSVAASLILIVGIGLLWNNVQNNAIPAENLTAENSQTPQEVPAAVQSNLPDDALAQVVATPENVSTTSPVKKKTSLSKNDLLEKKADDFVEQYADEDLDVIDYEILDYFSEEDYITFFLES